MWAPSCAAPCEPLGIGAGLGNEPVRDGVDGTWMGTSFGTATTCSGAYAVGEIPCGSSSIACAPAGNYLVKMCAGPISGPDVGDVQCVSVPFVFPTAEVVEGTIVLSAEDGGGAILDGATSD
jgi:hypothetical protein